ncbi:MAG: DUF3320 domain-containing protein, partial [Tannerellaceae bacterium]|nr:DUF3320 domain-containing protein [Tannerellaceae bacterium]
DERDVILFSVGYGPDKNGRVSMNFGPLNRIGGERRLNVAVSRARYEMMLFSTLQSEQIDLNRTASVGVAGLKRFLEYAEKGTRVPVVSSPEATEVVSVADLIAEELRRMGYQVHTHIGTSGYRIDAGIVYDEDPSRYVLGILCDGENYRNTKTARDREIVQFNVLRQLGWTICRVWTLDWYENPHAVLGAIMEAVRQAKTQMKTAVAEPVLPEVVAAPVVAAPVEEEWSVEEEKEEKTPYVVTNLKNKGEKIEELYYVTNRMKVRSRLEQVLQTEAPIARTLLYKRLTQAWGSSRQTQKVESYLEEVLHEISYYQTTHEGLSFFWKNEEQCLGYRDFRPVSDREAAELPPEEVANGIRSILLEQVSMPMQDLIRLTGQLFGFARSGTNIDAAMFRGLQEATRRDFVKFSGGKIVIR